MMLDEQLEEQIPSDLSDLASALAATFPDLAIVGPLQRLGEGFNSIALETADGIVFRVAKNEETTERHAMESKLLPALAPHVPLAIPVPRWHSRASSMLPFGAIGYRKLPGRPLPPSFPSRGHALLIAEAVATFLVELHGFPIERVNSLGVPGPKTRQARLEVMHGDILGPLQGSLSGDEFRKVAGWWERLLADERMSTYTPVLAHCDLWYENILVDDKFTTVLGILDFENSTVGDQAIDFATALHHRSGHELLRLVTDAYQQLGGIIDDDHSYRVQRLWELRPFDGIQYSVRFNDAAELEDSIAKLRQGPILSGPSTC